MGRPLTINDLRLLLAEQQVAYDRVNGKGDDFGAFGTYPVLVDTRDGYVPARATFSAEVGLLIYADEEELAELELVTTLGTAS